MDRTTLTWDQLRQVLASVELRDRLLLTLEMTEALRPSELLALRWKNFSFDECTLEVTETSYKGQLRPYGKTKRALGKIHLPEGLANDLWLWRQESPDPSPEAFIFPTERKSRKTGRRTFIDTGNYRHRVMKKPAKELGLPKLNFQVLRRTIATLAQKMGSLKDVQGVLRHDKIETTGNVYMQEIERSVQRTVNSIYKELRTKPKLVKAG